MTTEGDQIMQEVESFVSNFFAANPNPSLVFHDLKHTQQVVLSASEIAKAEKLSAIDYQIVVIAAWFHDVGYLEIYEGHEQRSVALAKEYLTSIEYPRQNIDLVIETILATELERPAVSHLDKVLCDADLAKIGSTQHRNRSMLLRQERQAMLKENLSDMEWIKWELQFLKQHTFCTTYAQKNWEQQKQLNIAALEKQLTT